MHMGFTRAWLETFWIKFECRRRGQFRCSDIRLFENHSGKRLETTQRLFRDTELKVFWNPSERESKDEAFHIFCGNPGHFGSDSAG